MDYMRHPMMHGPKRLEHFTGNKEWLAVPKANRVGITDDFLRRMATQ